MTKQVQYCWLLDTEGGVSLNVTNRVTRYWGGDTVTEKFWDGKWTRETRFTSYDASGCRVETVIAESSDYPAVTKSVTVRDFLGRAVSVATPLGVTSNFYEGASDRLVRKAEIGKPDTIYSYDEMGNLTATALDVNANGVIDYAGTDRISSTVIRYEEDASNVWWRVTSSAESAGGVTNSATEVREQLTGLSPALLGRTVSIDANAHTTTVTRAFEPGTDVIVETSRTGDAAPSVRRTLYGHEVESAGPDSAALSTDDGFGRAVSQTVTNGAGTVSTSAVVYDNLGNTVTNTTIYGDLTAVTSTGYDSQGRAVSWADALGNTVFTVYDSLGQTLSLSGATYPVQYAYDTVGRQTELDTTRDGLTWDKTRFLFDGATGLLTNKVYADGSRVVYAYTDVGRLASRTWARNIVTAYSYDTLGQTLTIDYPGTWYDVYYAYDVFGYASSSSNSFARYTFLNSLNGTATNETAVIGTNVFTLARCLDGHNRVEDTDMALEGISLGKTHYDRDTGGRISLVAFTNAVNTGYQTLYGYSDGYASGWEIQLGNGGTFRRVVLRDPHRPGLVTCISNTVGSATVSAFCYGHDLLGKRSWQEDFDSSVTVTNAYY